MVNGFTVWFTGLSGAGKSTLSGMLEARMRATGLRVELLDGDVVRTHLSKGLGFSKEDRDENIRRIGFVCELLSRNGVIAIVPPISPYRAVRDELRVRIRNFVEVYVESPIKVSAGHARLVEATIARWLRTGDPAKCRSTLCLIPIRA